MLSKEIIVYVQYNTHAVFIHIEVRVFISYKCFSSGITWAHSAFYKGVYLL